MKKKNKKKVELNYGLLEILLKAPSSLCTRPLDIVGVRGRIRLASPFECSSTIPIRNDPLNV